MGVVGSASMSLAPSGVVAALGMTGGALLILGSLLPWLSLYAGVDSISGIAGTNGRVLLGAGILSAALGILYAVRPSKQLQYGLATFGFGISAFAAWVLSQLIGSYQQLQADPFVIASLGAGAFIALGGGLVVLGTVLVPQRAQQCKGTARPRWLLLVVPTLGRYCLQGSWQCWSARR